MVVDRDACTLARQVLAGGHVSAVIKRKHHRSLMY